MTVVEQPEHGTLVELPRIGDPTVWTPGEERGSFASTVYVADEGFTGTDQAVFTLTDGSTGEQKTGTLDGDTVAGLVRMYAYMPAAGALLRAAREGDLPAVKQALAAGILINLDSFREVELLRSYDEGVAEFLDLERVKPNTLGNTRMLATIEQE